jgi:hypothetical protein
VPENTASVAPPSPVPNDAAASATSSRCPCTSSARRRAAACRSTPLMLHALASTPMPAAPTTTRYRRRAALPSRIAPSEPNTRTYDRRCRLLMQPSSTSRRRQAVQCGRPLEIGLGVVVVLRASSVRCLALSRSSQVHLACRWRCCCMRVFKAALRCCGSGLERLSKPC